MTGTAGTRQAVLWSALWVTVTLPAAGAAATYHPITASSADQTVILTGRALTSDQVVQVARYGAKVALSPEARQRSADAYGLLLEAAAEGVPVYWFNRGSGAGRQAIIFAGDPLTPKNKAMLEQQQLTIFRRGARAGVGPEVSDEEIVRAAMVVRANTMSFEAASPQLTQALLDLINLRITPVVRSRSTVGEGDLGPLSNIGAAMVGAGEVYFRGTRMSAAAALRAAALAPLQPFAADDSELQSSNAYASGQAALLVHDAREALAWADLTYAVDLNGMNSSVTPLAAPVQANRPFAWLNWHAARMLELLRGSYLFAQDPRRIIQDPESLRASSIRQASAWQAWAQLREDVLTQINSSDHNPAVRVGASPADSWELATPQLQQFYVKGGPRSHGQHGFILSNANWDPYPMANDLEAFSVALANMDTAIAQRITRFTDEFFTGVRLEESDNGEPGRSGPSQGSGIAAASLMQEIQGLAVPVAPEGDALVQNVEDLQSQTRLKVLRARLAVDDTIELLAEDLLTGTYWLDLREQQNPTRHFGAGATSVWVAFRKTTPFAGNAETSPAQSIHDLAAAFLRGNRAADFYAGEAPEPAAAH